MTRSVVLIGGPDSGKTNYIGRFWQALEEGRGQLEIAQQPEDLTFVYEVIEHLFAGDFAPRSEHTDERRDFEVVVSDKDADAETSLVIPDISGELWRNAVQEGEIASAWMEELRHADGALLFVRVQSDQEVAPLDWVTSQKMLTKLGNDNDLELPTQVMLCELIRFLEETLDKRPDGGKPRLSIVVSAWDMVDLETKALGPQLYLEKEYPLLGGRLKDIETLDVRVFGLSIVGGDLKADTHWREKLLDNGLDGLGWVTSESDLGAWTQHDDLTQPVAWVVGR